MNGGSFKSPFLARPAVEAGILAIHKTPNSKAELACMYRISWVAFHTMAASSRRIVRFIFALFFCVAVVFLLPESFFSTRGGHHEEQFTQDLVEEQPVVPTYQAPRIQVDEQKAAKRIKKVVEGAVILEKHRFRLDGLLEVNLKGPHPIYGLIDRAEKTWKSKHAQASRNLEEAVDEYTRRYNRAPPLGFDLWWKYVEDNNVQLPDEYDQIFHDLEPFWGIEPQELIETQAILEQKKDSFTIGKNDEGQIGILTYAFEEGRYDQLIPSAQGVVKLLEGVQDLLPSFRATFNPHDGPNRLSDYSIKKTALDAASGMHYVSKDALPKVSGTGWRFACPPDSLARRNIPDLQEPLAPSTKKTFIYDHLLTMDPCVHVSHFYQHGQYLSHRLGPQPQSGLIPEFSQCSTMLHHNIRYPTPYNWVEDVLPRSGDPPFDEKVDDRLSWRGRNTGMHHGKSTLWQNNHRDFLVRFSNDLSGAIQVIPPNATESEPLGGVKEFRKSRLNPAIMDIAFTEAPIACEDSVCRQLEEIYPFRPFQVPKEMGKHKYILDVDGNGWSGRFKRLMTTNALIFKSTIYPEWFMDRVQPWVHYVPIQVDLSDLHDTVLFFRGDGNGEGNHEELAEKIALAGREWSKTYWRKEDLSAYFFRLILEYARLMSLDRESMTLRPFEED